MSGLRLFTSNRVEILADELAATLEPPLNDPLTAEIILVQSRGMARWVSLELARRRGICANVNFPFPNHFVYDLFRRFVGGLPEESSFDPANLTWQIMGLLPSLQDKEGFEILKIYFGEESDSASELKRFQLSRRIADLFDQYLIFRPGMILDWEKGRESPPSHWQAILWRNLVKGKEAQHRAALQKAFLKQAGASLSQDLPQRVGVFGISALPPFHLQILEAIARFTEVNLFLMNPCREYWADIVSDREITRAAAKTAKPDVEPHDLYLEKGNSLLASMGALGRDFFSLIHDVVGIEQERYRDVEERDLLSAIQADILNLRERGVNAGDGDAKTLLSNDDRSVEIHSCHSPMREVEVLQDRLLNLFETDPKLEPGEILVMTPDIAAYAPFIEAVFDLPAADPRRIPFSIADRGMRQESPTSGAFLKLLDLAGSRFGAAQVMDILQSTAVRQTFSLSEEDVEQIRDWVRETNIRWGIDASSRVALNLPDLPQNTWRCGLDRMLLGYALPPRRDRADETFQDLLPYDRIEGGNAEALGNFLEFMERLFAHVANLDAPRTLEEWSCRLTGLLTVFFSPAHMVVFSHDISEIEDIRKVIVELAQRQTLSGFEGKIGLGVIRAWLKGVIDEQRSNSGFLTGGVTFCAMLPMRSIPFKVICLLGMGDDVYPRQDQPPSFDLMAENPKPGDRSRRKDDRYLFLETLLSARRNLYISYTGQNNRDNSERPPSVPVSELLDYIEQGFTFAEGSIRECLVTKHRLQAFSSAYFQNDERLLSFSEENFRAAQRNVAATPQRPTFISTPLPEPDAEWKNVDIDNLCRFFANPVKYFLTRRIGMHLSEMPSVLDETENFSLPGLKRYELRQNLLAGALRGECSDDAYRSALASGAIPLGTPGVCLYQRSYRNVETFLKRLAPHMEGGRAESVTVDLSVGEFRLTGRIENVFAQSVIHYRLAKAKANDRLRAWIHHLALNLMGFQDRYSTLLISEDLSLKYRAVQDAQRQIEFLLDTFWKGLRQPVPFFPESSWAYADGLEKGKEEPAALKNALDKWDGYQFKEKDDAYLYLFYGDASPFDNAFKNLAMEIIGPALRHTEKIE